MLPHERDFFISRIKSGYIRLKNNNIVYKFKINNDISYEAEEVYYETYEKGINCNLPTDDEIYKFLIDRELWNDEEEDRLTKGIPKYIENVKVEMFNNFEKSDEISRMRLYLDKAKDELYKIFEIRHQFDYLSCSGAALYAKWQFVIENCVTLIDGNNVDWNIINPHEILGVLNSMNIPEEDIRDMARNDPWSTIWNIGKKGGNLFNCPVSEYTEDQKRLIRWSIMYDNIKEYDDVPPQEVIDDDDCFDGWLILKGRNKKIESDKEKFENRLGKCANAQEIFVPVKCLGSPEDEYREDASTVFNMNNPLTHSIINARMNAVQHGTISAAQLPDIRNELNMQINRAAMNN